MKRELAHKIGGEDPKYHTKDMWDHIERGEYPSWTMYAQVMKPEEAENYRWNIFDMTKVWPHKDFPLRELAKLTLNKNVREVVPVGCQFPNSVVILTLVPAS